MQPQAALDRQVDVHGGKQRAGEQGGGGQHRIPGGRAGTASCPHGQRQRGHQHPGVGQHAMQGRQRQPPVRQQHGRQRRPCLPHIRQPQQQPVPDEQLQQHGRVAQRRDEGRRAARRQRIGRQPHESQHDAEQRRQHDRHSGDGQGVDQARRDRHPVGIVGRDVQQAFRNAKARGLKQKAESPLHAAHGLHAFDVPQQHGGHAAHGQGPCHRGQPAAQEAGRGKGKCCCSH
ncbi:hypothetical protein D3C73_1149490 [compost metagenome]